MKFQPGALVRHFDLFKYHAKFGQGTVLGKPIVERGKEYYPIYWAKIASELHTDGSVLVLVTGEEEEIGECDIKTHYFFDEADGIYLQDRVTHGGGKWDITFKSRLSGSNIDYIAVDEANFLSDKELDEWYDDMLMQGKAIIVKHDPRKKSKFEIK